MTSFVRDGGSRSHQVTRWRQGIAARLLARILLFSSVVTVFCTGLQLYVDFRNDIVHLERRLGEIERSYARSLGESLWALDERQLHLQAEGILSLPDIGAVQVREIEPTPVPLVVSVGMPAAERSLVRETTISCHCGGAERMVGVLRIEANLAPIYGALFDRAMLILASIGAKAFLVGLFAFYLMHRMVTRHLVELAAATERSNPLQSPAPLRLRRRAPVVPDEFDKVVEVLNQREDRLRRSVEELRVVNAALRRQQVELAASEKRHRELIDALPVPVFTLDTDGNLTMFNEAAVTFTGRRPVLGAPIGGSGSPLLWPDGTPVAFDERPSIVAMRTGRSLRAVETVVQRADGRWLHVLNYPTPLRDANGEISGVVSVYVDVTALKATESVLRKTSLQLAATIDNLPGVAYRAIFTPAGRRMVYISEACRAFVGLSPEEVCALSSEELNELFQMNDGPLSLEDAYRSLLDTGRFEATRHLRGADGRQFWGHFRARVTERRGNELVVDGLFVDVTTEMQARQALERSERHHRELLKALPVAVFTLDAHGRLTMYNEAAAAITGSRPDLGAPLGGLRLLWPDGREVALHERPTMVALREGRPLRGVETILERADGRRVHLLNYPTPLFDGDGEVVGVIGLFVDVTLLKSTEAALRETSGRLAALIDNLPGVAYRSIFTPTGRRVLYISEASRTFLGLAPDQVCALSLDELRTLYHPDDIVPGSGYRTLAETGQMNQTVRMRGADGGWFWANFRARLVERRGDELVVEGLFIDVTAEIQAKQALEHSERRYRTLLEAMPVGVFEDDLVTGNVYINETWVRLSGRSREELAGEGWMEAIHPEDRVAAVDHWRNMVANGIGGPSEFRLVRPDGTVVWVLTEAVPQYGPDGELVGYIATATDITERRRIEEKLRDAQHLEALGRLASGIAHDFNNLLGAIKGFARFIVEDAEPDSTVSYHAHRIVSAGKRARALVGQILGVGRRGEIMRREVGVAGLVSEAKDLLGASIPPGTRIVGPMGGQRLVVSADPDQLVQVLLNLCLNAHDALHGRPGTIDIAVGETDKDAEAFRRLAARAAAGADAAMVQTWVDHLGTAWAIVGAVDPAAAYVSLTVTDTGVGMPRALLENVFVAFFTTKEKGRGTGLGLAVVQGIVLAHGGAVIVASRPDEGTRFEVVLPAGVGAAVEPMPAPSAQRTAAAGRLLLVDDDADFGDMLLTALERRGFEVAPCADPAEALAGIRSDPDAWDAVVTDHSMPDMSGLDLIRAVKALRSDLPCILCSGYPDDLTSGALAAAGVLRVVPKPINIDDLVDTLIEAIATKP